MFTNKKSFIFVLLMIVSSFSLASKLEVDMAYEIIYGNQKGKIDFSANICKEYKKEFSPSYIPNTFILDINKSIYNGIFKCTFINSNDLIEYKFNPLTEQSFNNNTIPSFAKEYIDFNNFNKDSLDIMVIYDHRDFTKNEIEDRVDDFTQELKTNINNSTGKNVSINITGFLPIECEIINCLDYEKIREEIKTPSYQQGFENVYNLMKKSNADIYLYLAPREQVMSDGNLYGLASIEQDHLGNFDPYNNKYPGFVMAYDQIFANTFSHEFGHVAGFAHHYEAHNLLYGVFDFAKGTGWDTGVLSINGNGTIMSYVEDYRTCWNACDEEDVYDYFSNPNIYIPIDDRFVGYSKYETPIIASDTSSALAITYPKIAQFNIWDPNGWKIMEYNTTKNNKLLTSDITDIVMLGSGNDLVKQSSGNDVVTLGSGKDIFIMDENTLSNTEITDFTYDDRVQLNGFGWSSLSDNKINQDIVISYNNSNIKLRNFYNKFDSFEEINNSNGTVLLKPQSTNNPIHYPDETEGQTNDNMTGSEKDETFLGEKGQDIIYGGFYNCCYLGCGFFVFKSIILHGKTNRCTE